MSNLWMRYVELRVGDLKVSLKDFDVEFEVEKKEDEASISKITLFNLSDNKKEGIQYGDAVELKAGYQEDYDTIFYGKVTGTDFKRDGADERIIIECADSSAQLSETYVTAKYPKGTDAAQVVRDMCAYSSIPVGRVEDTGFKFGGTTVFGGTPRDIILNVIEFCNGKLRQARAEYLPKLIFSTVSYGDEYVFTIVNNMAYFIKGANLLYEVAVLKTETGLMEVNKVKEEDQDKYKIRSLLKHRIRVGMPVQIESEKITGQYIVSQYKHSCKDEDFITELEVIPSST